MARINSKLTAVIAAGVAALMMLSGCGGAKSHKAAKAKTAVKDTITAQVAYASRDFAPSTTSGALPMAANWHVTEPLYALDYSNFKSSMLLQKVSQRRFPTLNMR